MSEAPRQKHGERQCAVIDLGSNSWRLVVFSCAPGAWWKRTDELYETVRIGENLGATGQLSEPAIERGLETWGVFTRFCRAHRLHDDRIHAVATSAIRDASNRDEFLGRAIERTGLRIEVLSAEDEARFGYLAAVNTTTLTDGAVVELGGGSMQLIEVRDRRRGRTESYALGAIRLTEQLFPGRGPVKKKELQRVRSYVRDALSGADWLKASGSRLVGIGGAARNLAAAAQHAAGSLDVGVQGFRLDPATIDGLVRTLAALPARERGSLPGIKPGRGDIILAAALTLQTVLELGEFDAIEVTESGLREGVFFERALLGREGPLLGDVRAAAVRNLASQYERDLPHVEHVAKLAVEMHDCLTGGGLIEPRSGERELLWAAAMLHDVGMAVDYDDHHKHSQYLIVSSELPGFDPRERALIAQISRYHRKGSPKLGELAPLTESGDEALLSRCAVILRLAEHLERGRDQAVHAVRLQSNGDGVALHLRAAGDLTLPRWSVERYGDDEIFEQVFGRRLLIG